MPSQVRILQLSPPETPPTTGQKSPRAAPPNSRARHHPALPCMRGRATPMKTAWTRGFRNRSTKRGHTARAEAFSMAIVTCSMGKSRFSQPRVQRSFSPQRHLYDEWPFRCLDPSPVWAPWRPWLSRKGRGCMLSEHASKLGKSPFSRPLETDLETPPPPRRPRRLVA